MDTQNSDQPSADPAKTQVDVECPELLDVDEVNATFAAPFKGMVEMYALSKGLDIGTHFGWQKAIAARDEVLSLQEKNSKLNEMYEYLRECAEKKLDDLEAENKRLVERLNEFGVFGTDECVDCDTGRVTLYSKGRLCPECRNRYVALKAQPRGDGNV